MCLLECQVVDNDSYRSKAQDWVILAIMNTQCHTFRTDYLLYSISKNDVYEWRGNAGAMPIKFFWCRPDINIEDLDITTSMESKYQYLMKTRDDYFKVKKYIYDPMRCRPRDAKHEADSLTSIISPEELDVRDKMWTPILGPRLQATTASLKSKHSLRSNIKSTKRQQIVSDLGKQKVEGNDKTRMKKLHPVLIPSKKVFRQETKVRSEIITRCPRNNQPSVKQAPLPSSLKPRISTRSVAVDKRPAFEESNNLENTFEILERHPMTISPVNRTIAQNDFDVRSLKRCDTGATEIVKDVVMPLIDQITKLANQIREVPRIAPSSISESCTPIRVEKIETIKQNEDLFHTFAKYNDMRRLVAGDIRDDLCYNDQRDSNNRMALLHHDQYRHILVNGRRFDPVTHTPHHPQHNFALRNPNLSYEPSQIHTPLLSQQAPTEFLVSDANHRPSQDRDLRLHNRF
jgi:hypothetical protein